MTSDAAQNRVDATQYLIKTSTKNSDLLNFLERTAPRLANVDIFLQMAGG